MANAFMTPGGTGGRAADPLRLTGTLSAGGKGWTDIAGGAIVTGYTSQAALSGSLVLTGLTYQNHTVTDSTGCTVTYEGGTLTITPAAEGTSSSASAAEWVYCAASYDVTLY